MGQRRRSTASTPERASPLSGSGRSWRSEALIVHPLSAAAAAARRRVTVRGSRLHRGTAALTAVLIVLWPSSLERIRATSRRRAGSCADGAATRAATRAAMLMVATPAPPGACMLSSIEADELRLASGQGCAEALDTRPDGAARARTAGPRAGWARARGALGLRPALAAGA